MAQAWPLRHAEVGGIGAGAACVGQASSWLLATATPLFGRYHRQVIDPPQCLRDTPSNAGLIALAVNLLAGAAVAVGCKQMVPNTKQMLPRLALTPGGKGWQWAGAVAVGKDTGKNACGTTKNAGVITTGCVRPLTARERVWIPVNRAAAAAVRAPSLCGLRASDLTCELGAAASTQATVLAMCGWALPNTLALSVLSPDPIPVRAAPLGLARCRGALVPAQCGAGQHLSTDHRWRVRLVIGRPRWEAWKSPIPPEAAIPDRPVRQQIRITKPGFWPKLPAWHFVMAPARAAILAVPLLVAGIALWALTKPVLRQAQVERAALVETVQVFLRERSEVLIEDDFLSGISGWDGGPEWAEGWAYGAAGFVQPRKLALLRASLPLADYRLEFLGQIDKKSLGWVFRASDLNNYYAMKITIAKPGPLPLAAIVRYTVVDGAAVDRVQLPLPLSIRNDTLYRVETSAVQDRFTTSINGQVVDTFFDRRHPSGGVGLFSGPGESSRVLWVRVAEQDDLLGRLCAYFSSDSTDHKTAFLPRATKKKAMTEQ